jgi:hypothetical protein
MKYATLPGYATNHNWKRLQKSKKKKQQQNKQTKNNKIIKAKSIHFVIVHFEWNINI